MYALTGKKEQDGSRDVPPLRREVVSPHQRTLFFVWLRKIREAPRLRLAVEGGRQLTTRSVLLHTLSERHAPSDRYPHPSHGRFRPEPSAPDARARRSRPTTRRTPPRRRRRRVRHRRRRDRSRRASVAVRRLGTRAATPPARGPRRSKAGAARSRRRTPRRSARPFRVYPTTGPPRASLRRARRSPRGPS